MTYFIDCLETSFKYLSGCQQNILGKLYTFTRVNMPKILNKYARKNGENTFQ